MRIDDSRSLTGVRSLSRLTIASTRREGLDFLYGDPRGGLLRGGVLLRRAKIFWYK